MILILLNCESYLKFAFILQIISLFAVSAVFSYVPSFDKTYHTLHGMEGFELGEYGKFLHSFNTEF